MSIRNLPDSPPVFGRCWNTPSRPFPPPAEPLSALTARERWPEHFAPLARQGEEAEGGGQAGGEASRGYRVRSDEAWRAAREDYEAGFAAEAVCKRYDLGLSAFRQRARREGWRREDGAAEAVIPASLAEEAEAGPPPAPPTAELVDLAWRSGAQAIARGEVYKARAWIKLARELREEVRAEENRARWAEHDALERLAADARIAALTARKRAEVEAAPGAIDGELHTLHPKSDVQSADLDALVEEAEALDAAAEAALDADDEDGFEGYVYDEEEEAEAADALARERAMEAGLHGLHHESRADPLTGVEDRRRMGAGQAGVGPT